MKLRIQGNSLRVRVGRAELAHFLSEGRITDTIRFTPAPEARLTYALEVSQADTSQTQLRYTTQEIAVILGSRQVAQWRLETEVGIYTRVPIGAGDSLDVIVEKDFACLDRSDKDNKDTFANPLAATNCQVG
jgi:hypothetical protein